MPPATLRSRLLTTGIRRLGGARNGFFYRRVDRRAVSAPERRRIETLRIPSTWRDVFIACSPRDKVQAVGRDSAGRWQYLYGRSHAARRSREKFDRLVAFGEALPALRRAVSHDLAREGLPREKAMACAVALLSTCFIRPGTEIYAAENGSFGLATLRDRHVSVEGDVIRLDFRGKHGRRQRHEVRSARLARIVREMKRRPGPEIFKFVEPSGRVRDLRRSHLNGYIKRIMGVRFSARDFRTWAGTLLCASALARAAQPDRIGLACEGREGAKPLGGSTHRSVIANAIRETASQLGNSEQASREAYIHPAVLRAFERGAVIRHPFAGSGPSIVRRESGLDRSERALIELLEREQTGRRSFGTK